MRTSSPPSAFQVIVSVWGRFHAFNLAQSLVRSQRLSQLITSYPRFEVIKYGIPAPKVSAFPWLEVMARSWNRLPAPIGSAWNPKLIFSTLYDRSARSALREGSEIFVGWSGFSLQSLRRAKELGMVTVLERGSSHIVVQQSLLEEEYARFGMRFTQTHKGIIEKELAEYKEADFVSVPSGFVRDSFVAQGFPQERLIQVPYGVDLSSFHPVKREDDKFRVIYCGTLCIRKGISYLLQAFAEAGLPDAELWLVGNVMPEILPALKRYSHPGIKVLGPRKQTELKWYYGQSDLFAIASIEEGLAMVQAQAMACGLPVMCTLNTGGAELIRHGKEGFIHSVRDVEGMKERIQWCYENRETCRVMGEAARQRVAQGYRWDDYGEKMIAQYQRVLDLQDVPSRKVG